MEQIYFGERIAGYRKAQGLTQEGLAQKLGVTNQAVSKWESDQCCPDIMLLPGLADVFSVSIDELFGRSPLQPAEAGSSAYTVIDELPWPDDECVRAVCYVGRRLADYMEAGGQKNIDIGRFMNIRIGNPTPVELHFTGSVRDIYAAGSVICGDSVIRGNVHAEESVYCGEVRGDVSAGDGVSCGNVGGGVSAGDSVMCGNVGGDVQAGDSVNCGNIGGSAEAGDGIRCSGMQQ